MDKSLDVKADMPYYTCMELIKEDSMTAATDLVRAVEHGVEIKQSVVGTFATSATVEGLLYRVSEHHCDCQGFFHRGHCKHNALFMAHKLDQALAFFGIIL